MPGKKRLSRDLREGQDASSSHEDAPSIRQPRREAMKAFKSRVREKTLPHSKRLRLRVGLSGIKIRIVSQCQGITLSYTVAPVP